MVDLAQSVYDICVVLSDLTLTAREVALRLGTITNEDGDVDCSINGWKKARIHVRSGSETVNDITLEPEAPLPLARLSERFGAPRKRTLLNPYANPRWAFPQPEGTINCTIDVEVPEDAENVIRVMVVSWNRAG